MSFSHETKAGLVSLSEQQKHDCCRKAELYGIMYTEQVFTRTKCKLVTTNTPLSELILKRLSSLYGVSGNIYVTEKKSGEVEDRHSSKITVVQKKDLDRLFSAFRYTDGVEETNIIREMFKCSGCLPAFIRGAFLTSGTVTNPDRGYHLELSLTDERIADNMAEILSEAGFEAKRMLRKKEHVLYFKDSESIENFLAYIGANTAAFVIMNKKIEKELRSSANRIANGELANIGKTVSAASDQIAAIKALQSLGELDLMPEELKLTALLRLENSDATLSELAALHEPPITKSGVNHRLKKILEWRK